MSRQPTSVTLLVLVGVCAGVGYLVAPLVGIIAFAVALLVLSRRARAKPVPSDTDPTAETGAGPRPAARWWAIAIGVAMFAIAMRAGWQAAGIRFRLLAPNDHDHTIGELRMLVAAVEAYRDRTGALPARLGDLPDLRQRELERGRDVAGQQAYRIDARGEPFDLNDAPFRYESDGRTFVIRSSIDGLDSRSPRVASRVLGVAEYLASPGFDIDLVHALVSAGLGAGVVYVAGRARVTDLAFAGVFLSSIVVLYLSVAMADLMVELSVPSGH